MKKVIFLVIAFLFILCANVNAQTYRMNKQVYNPQLYMPQFGDPYNPALSGVASFFIPGLGQMISGEVGRGFAFLGGVVGCSILTGVGMAQLAINNSYFDPYYDNDVNLSGLGTILFGVAGMLVLDIWAIVDAVKVAKVNNMYIQDMRQQSRIEMELSPYIEPISIYNTASASVGLTVRMRF